MQIIYVVTARNTLGFIMTKKSLDETQSFKTKHFSVFIDEKNVSNSSIVQKIAFCQFPKIIVIESSAKRQKSLLFNVKMGQKG